MRELDRQLRAAFGDPPAPQTKDPLDLLIRTILSQNTTDRNRDAAFEALRRKFPSWEEVAEAPEGEVAEAIQPAGLQRERAHRIQEILRRIRAERGAFSLSFLAQMEPVEAEKWVLSLPGVGKKTAYIVLLFAFGYHRFPVDTHIKRVSQRLGLWNGKGDPHRALAPLIPEGRAYELHLNLIRLGRTLCRPKNPRCRECPVLRLCPFGQEKVRGEHDQRGSAEAG